MSSVFKSVTKETSKKSDEDALTTSSSSSSSSKRENKQRVLILSSRGVTYRQRHLLTDISNLLPHSRKESKLDTKSKLYQLNELADLYNCNNILFFESRKRQDLYMWMSKAPNGPCIKFHVQNLHTMEELHFAGNCLKGSRPVLSFDKGFDGKPYSCVIKEVLMQVFGVPKGARRSKPFVDHVMSFTLADGKVWMRCYQIDEKEASTKEDTTAATTDADGDEEMTAATDKEKEKKKSTGGGGKKETNLSLLEIGPRLVLTPIVIQESSFGGPIIYENKEFVSPNVIRSEIRRKKAQRFDVRAANKAEREVKKKVLGLNESIVGGRGGAAKDWEEREMGLTGLF